MPLNVTVIYGSVRSQRLGIRAAHFIIKMLKGRKHKVTLVDPLELKLPLLDRRYSDYGGNAPEKLKKLAAIFRASDAFVIVSGEYNHSIPPALSNLLDHFYEEYFWRPSAIACYSAGPFGGVRAAMQLRAMLAELGMPSIPAIFPIPKVQDAFDEQGNAKDESYSARINRFLDELEWYAEALKAQRKKGLPR